MYLYLAGVIEIGSSIKSAFPSFVKKFEFIGARSFFNIKTNIAFTLPHPEYINNFIDTTRCMNAEVDFPKDALFIVWSAFSRFTQKEHKIIWSNRIYVPRGRLFSWVRQI